MKKFSTMRTLLACVLVALFLSACGGGGGGASPDPAHAVLSDAQGRWHGNVNLSGGSQMASALVLPDGQAWLQFTTSGGVRRLVQGNLSVNGQQLTGAAKLFDLDSGHLSGELTWTANATAGSSLALNSSDATQVGRFTSTSFVSQNTPSISAIGVWRDVPSAPTVQWTIGIDGSLSGTATGCTVVGHVLPRGDSAAVADVDYDENCGGTITSWTGVSLNGPSLDSLKFTLINSDKTKALILELVK